MVLGSRGPESDAWCPYEEQEAWGQEHADTRDDEAIRGRQPLSAQSHQQRKRQEDSSPETSEAPLISDSWPPGL